MSLRRPGCLLRETSQGWQLAATGTSRPHSQSIDENSTEAVVDAVEKFVTEHRLRRDQLVIATHSSRSLFATFPSSELTRSRDRQTLTYQLESALPCDAEQLVADFVIGEQVVSGTAVNRQDFLPLVVALEERGMLVQSIAPAAVLACQALFRQQPALADGLLLWHTGEGCEWLRLRGGQLVQWRHLPASLDVISRELRVQLLDADDAPRVTLIDAEEEFSHALSTQWPEIRQITTDGFVESSRRLAGDVLAGSQTPWFELRRDRLANGDPHRTIRKNVSWLTSAVAVFLLALAAAGGMRTAQLNQEFASIKQQQRDLFQRAFPDSPVPRAIVSRIHSEHVKMIASRQVTDDVPQSQSALEVLHGFLAAQPTNLRSRMTEIRIENGIVIADVELRSHDDAGTLAASLEESGFVVDPPTTTQTDERTVVTRMRAQWSPDRQAAAQPVSLPTRTEGE